MTSVLAKAEQFTRLTMTTVEGEIAELDGWAIDTSEDIALAGDMVKDVKRRYKGLEAQRTSITGPMNQALKNVNDLFRAPKQLLFRAEKILKCKIADYAERVESQNQQLADVAGAADTAEQASEALAAIQDTAPPKGVSVRYVWKAEIVDESKIPREFMVPNLMAIEAQGNQLRREGLAVEMMVTPGVSWRQESIVSARTKE